MGATQSACADSGATRATASPAKLSRTLRMPSLLRFGCSLEPKHVTLAIQRLHLAPARSLRPDLLLDPDLARDLVVVAGVDRRRLAGEAGEGVGVRHVHRNRAELGAFVEVHVAAEAAGAGGESERDREHRKSVA